MSALMDYTFPDKFYKAAEVFDSIIGDLQSSDVLDNEHKLMFYALRQQAEKGPCTEPTPSMWRFVERHKHSAWCKLSQMSSFEAMVHFVRCAETTLFPGEQDVNWRAKYEALRVARDAESQSPCDAIAPARSSAHAVSADMCEDPAKWDADLRDHRTPTEENIMYLASQVMHARRQLEVLHASHAVTTVHHVPVEAQSALSTSETTSTLAHEAAATGATQRDKTELVRRVGGSLSVLPPGMVNISTGSPDLPAVGLDADGSPDPSPRPQSTSWMDWFGW